MSKVSGAHNTVVFARTRRFRNAGFIPKRPDSSIQGAAAHVSVLQRIASFVSPRSAATHSPLLAAPLGRVGCIEAYDMFDRPISAASTACEL